jgi:hypothetical protein
VLTACALAPAAALAGTLDQQQTSHTAGFGTIDGSQSAAQTFTAGLGGRLDQVDLYLIRGASPTAPLSVEIRNVSGGVPGASVLASSSIQAGSVPPVNPGFLSLSFAAPAPVVAGTQYSIVTHSATDSGGAGSYGWATGNTPADPYPGGTIFFTPTSPPLGGWTPTAPDADYAFRTYVVPTAAPGPTGQRAAALKKCKKKKSKKARKKCKRKAKKLPA